MIMTTVMQKKEIVYINLNKLVNFYCFINKYTNKINLTEIKSFCQKFFLSGKMLRVNNYTKKKFKLQNQIFYLNNISIN